MKKTNTIFHRIGTLCCVGVVCLGAVGVIAAMADLVVGRGR